MNGVLHACVMVAPHNLADTDGRAQLPVCERCSPADVELDCPRRRSTVGARRRSAKRYVTHDAAALHIPCERVASVLSRGGRFVGEQLSYAG